MGMLRPRQCCFSYERVISIAGTSERSGIDIAAIAIDIATCVFSGSGSTAGDATGIGVSC